MASRSDAGSAEQSSQSESFSVDESIKTPSEAEKNDDGLRQWKLLQEGSTIIMPLDASNHSLYCLTFYVKFIHKPENRIHVCYVAEDYARSTNVADEKGPSKCGCMSCLKRLLGNMTLLESMGPSPGVIKELEREDKANFKAIKSKVRDAFKANQIQNWDMKRLTGLDPCTAILDYRTEMGGTMIVLGSRGLGLVKRKVLGSVSEKVLRKSPVPVLIVRLPIGALHATTDLNTGSSMIA